MENLNDEQQFDVLADEFAKKLHISENVFKVAFKNKPFKEFAASTLIELKEKATVELIGGDVEHTDYDLYLEDKTLVDDEDYFTFLDSGTKLLLKNRYEESVYSKLKSPNVTELFILLTDDELYDLSEEDPHELAKKLQLPENLCDVFVDCAFELLSRRIKYQEFCYFKKLYDEIKSNM